MGEDPRRESLELHWKIDAYHHDPKFVQPIMMTQKTVYPKLNAEEAAAAAKTRFPDKPEYRDMLERDMLSRNGLGKSLTTEEDKKLRAMQLFEHDHKLRAQFLKYEDMTPDFYRQDIIAAHEFPNNPHLQDLTKRAIETSTWGRKVSGDIEVLGRPRRQTVEEQIESSQLTTDEKAELTAAREFNGEPHFESLAKKEYLAIKNLGEHLTDVEQVEINARRNFSDPHYYDLERRDIMASIKQGEPLNAFEYADLHSMKLLPYDGKYRELERLSILNETDVRHPLPPEDAADLRSYWEFFGRDDWHDWKDLSKKEYLGKLGAGPKLTGEESASLWFKRTLLYLRASGEI